ncbi:hypothetical protein GCM10022219_19070 [Microbacterium oryzae]|uniref:M23ase beta-sheet core domain-containing protein n=1 Tax=Microbacterium oryzae TaxID=743009 RepID=A0A6I6E4Y3_9MICO|nr:M23 family metallopeptidase [Microbacterium oryzae]QGU27817.1 hypothetical protein D7D94_09185 [Microbacterium oryzae]
MHSEISDRQSEDEAAQRPRATLVAHVGVAVAALVAVTTGASALAVGRPVPESAPVAAVSLAVDPSQGDEAEPPESPTAGFSDEAARFAEQTVEVPDLASSSYGATTIDELTATLRKAREALIGNARAAGLDVDLSRLGDDKDLPSLGKFIWPVANPTLTDPFGARGGRHMGMDMAAAGGTPITAASPGIVVLSSESHYGYGVAVIIQHVNGVRTLYGHMIHGSRAVQAGDWVEAGDPIGLVGNTGHSFGNHLHFEVHVDGVPVDPRRYLDGAGDPVDVKPWQPVPGGAEPAQVPPSAEPSPSEKPDRTPEPKPTEPTRTPEPTKTPEPSKTPPPTTAPPKSPQPTPPPATQQPSPQPTKPPATAEPTEPPATTQPEPTQPPQTSEPAPSAPPTTAPPEPSAPAPAPSAPAPSAPAPKTPAPTETSSPSGA